MRKLSLLALLVSVLVLACGMPAAPTSLEVGPAILVEPLGSSLGRVTISGILGKPSVVPDPGGYFSVSWVTEYTLLEVTGLEPTVRDTPAKLLIASGTQQKIVQITITVTKSGLVFTMDVSDLQF